MMRLVRERSLSSKWNNMTIGLRLCRDSAGKRFQVLQALGWQRMPPARFGGTARKLDRREIQVVIVRLLHKWTRRSFQYVAGGEGVNRGSTASC